MSTDLLKQLQRMTAQFPVYRFKVIVLAFGQVFEGTTVAHRNFAAMWKAVSASWKFDASNHGVKTAMEKTEEAFVTSMRDESDAMLYLADVTIDGSVPVQLLTLPFDEIKTWSIVGQTTVAVSELMALGA